MHFQPYFLLPKFSLVEVKSQLEQKQFKTVFAIKCKLPSSRAVQLFTQQKLFGAIQQSSRFELILPFITLTLQDFQKHS